MEQVIIRATAGYPEIDQYIKENEIKNVLLVYDGALNFLKLKEYFETAEERLGIKLVRFDNIQPNPLYEGVCEGVDLLRANNCDTIITVGGGSVMDTAKCIKLYANMDPEINYLKQEIVPNDIRLMAIPTTAGTGSEATRYAAIYFEGAKQSVTHTSSIPSAVVVDPTVLKTLPEYQKKATMLDALCHCIESFWSVNSNEESYQYSAEGIKLIMDNFDGYVANDEEANANMLRAANISGKAINITQTTAGHAMCYKITSLFGTSHGHAAALCVAKLMPHTANNLDKCIDARGPEYLAGILQKIAEAMGCANIEEAAEKFQNILYKLELNPPVPTEKDYEILKTSVNPVRLKNYPVQLDEETIDGLYHAILAPWN